MGGVLARRVCRASKVQCLPTVYRDPLNHAQIVKHAEDSLHITFGSVHTGMDLIKGIGNTRGEVDLADQWQQFQRVVGMECHGAPPRVWDALAARLLHLSG